MCVNMRVIGWSAYSIHANLYHNPNPTMQSQKNLSQESRSFIGHGTTFIGDISTDHDIRIDGTLNGNILKANRLFIGKQGFLNGNAQCRDAEIVGKVNGKLVVLNLLYLHEQAVINGDIEAGSLRLEEDSVYNGYLRTGKSVGSVSVFRESSSQVAVLKKRR
jgi:cytoskeletal protein CcmA (bactofilin family)